MSTQRKAPGRANHTGPSPWNVIGSVTGSAFIDDSLPAPRRARPDPRVARRRSAGARVHRACNLCMMSPEQHDPAAFDVDDILTEASVRTGGLDDLGEGPFLEPLALFLESLEREARLNDLGRLIARERALLHTVNRL